MRLCSMLQMRSRFYANLPIFGFGLVIGLFVGILIGGW